MSDHRIAMEELCRSIVNTAVDAHNSTHVDFKGASFFTKKQINSALQNSYNKGLGRLECEIASEIHSLSYHGNKDAILNYDQAVFVNKYADILVMMELDDDEA